MMLEAVLVVKIARAPLTVPSQAGADRAARREREDVRRDAGCAGELRIAAEGVGRVLGGLLGIEARRGGDFLDELEVDIIGLQAGVLEQVADEREMRTVDLRDQRLALQIGERGDALGDEAVRAGGRGELQDDDRLQVGIVVLERLRDERDHVCGAAQERGFAAHVVLHLLVEVVDDLQLHGAAHRAGERGVWIRLQPAVGRHGDAVGGPGDERDRAAAPWG